MTENEINVTANYIKKLASMPDAEERIKLYLDSLFDCALQQKGSFDVQENTEQSVSSKIIFTHKEIKNMAKSFKKVFIANGLCAHILKKPSGKNSFCYEIRYRANGYDIRVSSTNLQKAKEKFLTKTTPTEIQKYFVGASSPTQNFASLEQFAQYFFKTHRKGKVTPKTYKCDEGRLKNHIFPALGKMPLPQITPDKCQTLINSIKNEGKGKTADEIYSLLSIIFKGAIAYGIIQKSPLAMAVRTKTWTRYSSDQS